MRQALPIALICAGMAAVCCGTPAAHAADIQTGVYPQYQPAGVVTEYTSGWYLRGDIGWRADTSIGDAYSAFPVPSGLSIDNIVTGGGGGGYKWNWFRADVTVDFSGRARFATTAAPNGAYDAKVSTLVALANVYLDLGTWSGVTPYVGVGAGVANYWIYDYMPPGPNNPDGQSKADFAWAFMAGVAWCFAPRWSVDLNYRRLELGETTFNAHLANALTLKDMTANEFRIGLRYNLD